MASIHKDILIDANSNDVWDAVRDFHAVHQRLVPGSGHLVRQLGLGGPPVHLCPHARP